VAFEHTRVVEVRLGGRTVGALAPGQGVTQFQYDPAWIRTGIELAPFLMPLTGGSRIYEFRGLRAETFFTLPPTIADSLPDRFGNALIDAWMQRQGITAAEVTPLDRLAYVDGRAMGALEFEPTNGPAAEPPTIIDLAALTVAAREAISSRLDGDDARTTAALRTLLRVGTSAGGARPKAVLNLVDATGEFRSGVLPPRDGESAWLLKFDGATDEGTLAHARQYTRIEYAYSLMARDAGIEMMPTQLLHEGTRAHFLTRRFDRPAPGERIHMTTLCGMRALDNDLVGAHDYAQLMQTIVELGLGEDALVEAFRRMAFNVMAVNHDDHTKNHAFLMAADGRWSLAPAYDVTYANVAGHPYLGRHCLGVDGEYALIDRDRMLRLADRFDIPYAKRELERVRAVVDDWPAFAARAQVPPEQIRLVGEAHRTLGRGIAP